MIVKYDLICYSPVTVEWASVMDIIVCTELMEGAIKNAIKH